MKLWSEITRLEFNIVNFNAELYKNLKPGISLILAQEIQNEHQRYLPRDVLGLFLWRNGTKFDSTFEKKISSQFIPLKSFISMGSSMNGCINDKWINKLYMKHRFLHEEDEAIFAPLMITSDFQRGGELDYVVLCPVTRIQKESLPLLNFDSIADAGQPYFNYDDVSSMLSYMNCMYEENYIEIKESGRISVKYECVDKEHELWAKHNPLCNVIDSNG